LVIFAFEAASIQLVPDGTLLFHLFLIVVMVVLLNATLLKPINRILEERDRRTKGRLTEAERVLVEVNDALRAYETRMREARGKGYKLLEEQRAAASSEREQRLTQVKAEVTHWLDGEKNTIQLEQEQVKADLRKDARNRALEISSQILRRPVRQ
jgi:F-type H+-transporting ATPase subunit b